MRRKRRLVLRIDKQAVCTKFSASVIDNHMFKEEELETVGEIVQSLLSSRTENRSFGSHRQTSHSVVCNQTDKRCHEMDYRVRGPFDIVHSQHE